MSAEAVILVDNVQLVMLCEFLLLTFLFWENFNSDGGTRFSE